MTKNFAHRGFSGKYPENTMLAFRKAIEVGVDGIELDVHLTKDGQLVIIHDETTDRTCGVSGRVGRMTLEELRQLDASYLWRGQMEPNPIPTLREYCQLVEKLPLVTNIELKTNVNEYPGIEAKVLELIREFRLEDRIIISSFNHFSVLRMRELAPELKYGLLSESWVVGAGKYVHDLGIPCYHPIHGNLTPEFFQKIKDLRLQTVGPGGNGQNPDIRMTDGFHKQSPEPGYRCIGASIRLKIGDISTACIFGQRLCFSGLNLFCDRQMSV